MHDGHLTLIFFGISGSGKGTQAKLLQDYLKEKGDTGVLYIEAGQLLRTFAEQANYTSRLVKSHIESGKLLPSFAPIYVTSEYLVRHFTGEEHLIFDGLVRRSAQALLLDSTLRFYGRTKYTIVDLELSPEKALERLLARGRSDDDAEKIKRRLDWYEETVRPVLKDYIGLHQDVLTINGDQSIEDIHEDIKNGLGV